MSHPETVASSVPRTMRPLVDAISSSRRRRDGGGEAGCLDALMEHLRDAENVSLRRDDLDFLQECILSYCGAVGYEFDHCETHAEREFVAQLIERRGPSSPLFGHVDALWIYEQLLRAEGFERLLGRRYSTARRFGLEGLEAAVPAVNAVVDAFAFANGSKGERRGAVRPPPPRVLLGTQHRGRLNFTANVLKVPLEDLLSTWDGTQGPTYDDICDPCSRDVRVATSDAGEHRKCRISMPPIAAHLESGISALAGKARAHAAELASSDSSPGIDLNRGKDEHEDVWRAATRAVLPLSVHGDSSFCGQGIVQETLQLGTCKHYDCGGTIHLILNNQVGFTTELSAIRSPRSRMLQASDVARSVGAPILHVNGASPHEAVRAALLALAYRQEFGKDVVIDLWGWRRNGHNELDDPTVTNVRMCEKVRGLESVSAMFRREVESDGGANAALLEKTRTKVEGEFELASRISHKPTSKTLQELPDAQWRHQGSENRWSCVNSREKNTSVSKQLFNEAAQYLTSVPDGFSLHPTVKKVADARKRELSSEDGKVDWATSELLALSTLALEGTKCRLSGQDVERGTFSQRHAVWYDSPGGQRHVALPPLVEVCNSPLSELGVIGFDFGWSLVNPDSLVIWEGQFGDFANNAEVLMDTLIAASNERWKVQSGLVLCLPHGYDGMGPEHSSSRLERWLQLFSSRTNGKEEMDADEASNMTVAYPTDPSNYFHLLRRQLARPYRRPLVVLSPKRTLRLAAATSPISHFINGDTPGQFSCVIDDPIMDEKGDPSAVMLCSGEIYYDLCQLRSKRLIPSSVPIIRIEQLAPFPHQELESVLESYPNMRSAAWVQEEPKNQGALAFVQNKLAVENAVPLLSSVPLTWIARPEAAAPAIGHPVKHVWSQEQLFREVIQWARSSSHEVNTSKYSMAPSQSAETRTHMLM